MTMVWLIVAFIAGLVTLPVCFVAWVAWHAVRENLFHG